MAGVSERTLERIEQAAQDLANELGLQVVRVEYLRGDIGWTLSVAVTVADGTVGVEDCARLARPLSKKLDELDLIQDHYYLEVCSPGAA